MQDRNYVILDCETTGLDPETNAEIVQISVKGINGNDLADHHSKQLTLILKPQHPELAEPKAIQVIGPELWEKAQKEGLDPKTAIRAIFNYIWGLNIKKGKWTKPIMVAHNAKFDHKFITYWAKHYKIIKSEDDLPYDFRILDTVGMFMMLYENDPTVKAYNLDTWLSKLNMARASNTHGADEDVKLLSLAFVRTLKLLRKVRANMIIAESKKSNEVQTG